MSQASALPAAAEAGEARERRFVVGKGRTGTIKTMALDLRRKQVPKQREVEKAFIKENDKELMDGGHLHELMPAADEAIGVAS